MNIDKKALKGIIDEIEASKTRQKAESELQREAIKRAVKQHQLDGKALRLVLQRRAMGDAKRDEQDYYVHAYELALGGKKDAIEALENGASVREAAALGGISRGAAGNLRKGVQKSEKMDTSETQEVQPAGTASGTAVNEAAQPAAVATSSNASPGACVDGESANTSGADSTVPRPSTTQTASDWTRAVTPAPEGGLKGLAPIPTLDELMAVVADLPSDEIDLTPPPHLDRRASA